MLVGAKTKAKALVEETFDNRLSNLRQSNHRLSTALEKERASKLDWFDSVRVAALDAINSLEFVPIKPPKKDKRTKENERVHLLARLR